MEMVAVIGLMGLAMLMAYGFIRIVSNAEEKRKQELYALYLRQNEERRLERIAELARIQIANELGKL